VPTNTFVICSPLETSLSDVWKRWITVLKPAERLDASLDGILQDESVSLIAFFGNEQIHQVLDDSNLRQSLRKKIVYHMGSTRDSQITDGDAESVKAYFGYEGSAPAFLVNVREENLFRDAFLVGLKSLIDRSSLSTALEATKDAWRKLIDRNRKSHYDLMVRLYARNNLEKLVFKGDPAWAVSGSPRIILAVPRIASLLRPRIEVINLSPVILKWLQEDFARINKLTAEQFEDLVADRLTKAGLSVVKTGKTNTPDGGIDLIASSRSSPVPYLLAAQIKHSRTNRLVSANVVRDFRGAISALPIDIGVIVTNTSFTPDAEWTARQLPKLIRLRNIEDLKLWLADELDAFSILRDLPSSIEVAPNLVIPIPWSIK